MIRDVMKKRRDVAAHGRDVAAERPDSLIGGGIGWIGSGMWRPRLRMRRQVAGILWWKAGTG